MIKYLCIITFLLFSHVLVYSNGYSNNLEKSEAVRLKEALTEKEVILLNIPNEYDFNFIFINNAIVNENKIDGKTYYFLTIEGQTEIGEKINKKIDLNLDFLIKDNTVYDLTDVIDQPPYKSPLFKIKPPLRPEEYSLNHPKIYNIKNEGELISSFKEMQAGDTIIIKKGTYVIDNGLELYYKKNIKIIGEGDVKILLKDAQQNVLSVSSSINVHIEGLFLKHVTKGPCGGYVIDLVGVKNTTVKGCRMDGSGQVGLNARSSSDIIVIDSVIENNSYTGFLLSRLENVKIENNLIQNNGMSVFIGYDVNMLSMKGNITKDNN
ncbi:MAG: right-handed parallel beta-helix repeat-containing protein [Bacteroidales bacterium]|nr:right-handed parallel beta-helix repeat-containing protein [Bacteroidales bacterium]